MRFDVEDMARELTIAHEPYVRATVVWTRPPSSGSVGDVAIVRLDGSLHGWVGGACAEPVVSAEARDVLMTGRPRLIFLGPEGESRSPDIRTVAMSCASEGALEIFMEPVVRQPHVVIVGRSPAVSRLARLLDVMDWYVTIVDEEGKGGDLLDDWPVVSQFADVDTASAHAIVVATQGHYDEDALEWATKTDAPYIGLVASERRAATLLEYLRALPTPDERVSRIRVRTGIDLGDVTHEEMAVSILAELVAERASGALLGGDHPRMEPIAATALDPVCGMSVEIEGARFTHDHLGETVYFCCPGCRTAFISDPDAYTAA
jgi:xanthine dehydrogenase accessory factor